MVASNARSSNACESCRRRKVKCSGEHPCRSCVKRNWDCNFGHSGRRRYSEAQVKQLLEKIQSYEKQLTSQPTSEGRSIPDTSLFDSTQPISGARLSPPAAPDLNPSHLPQQPEPATPGASVANNQPQGLAYDHNVASISPDLTSGPAFESQVRSLLDRSNQYVRSPGGMGYRPHTGGQWTSVETLVDDADDSPMPSLEESQHLLDQFLFYLGVSQHFFDSRSFSDSMVLLFQSSEIREQQKRTTWYTQYLLVMAMATLMDVEQPTPQPPGSSLFAEALRRLPPLYQLGGGGILVVEILTLIATYLQWCDRKHDAYLYIGLAMRLSISLGCNLPENEQDCLPSQSTHRVRLWWTVYMLDRRLSSSLGLAAGADERQLRTGFPRHAVGFQSPVAIIINIRIARVTDEIMSSLYGNATVTQLELVQKIQNILQELHDIGRSFPQSFILDFNRPLQTVTRTGSSLYLMLFQAIILCTRPMLLRRVRLLVQQQHDSQFPEPAPDILARLCDTCNEAATRSLAILYALRRQRIIPRYGFFDLDATFSAAFVLVMMGFTNNTRERPPAALDQAFEVLRFLSRSGNSAAEQRFHDITQSSSRVWPNYTFNSSSSDRGGSEIDFGSSEPARYSVAKSDQLRGPLPHPLGQPPQSMAVAPDSQPHPWDESRFLEPWEYASTSDPAFDIQGEWNIDLSGDAEGIYSSFHNPTLPLTGVDYMDWLEIEKVLNAQAAC